MLSCQGLGENPNLQCLLTNRPTGQLSPSQWLQAHRAY